MKPKYDYDIPPGVWAIGSTEDGRTVLVSINQDGTFRRVELVAPEMATATNTFMITELRNAERARNPERPTLRVIA